MGVGMITPRFDRGAINAKIAAAVANWERATIYMFSYLGELCTVEARDNGTYMDRTANLRSSTGYVVSKDGRPVKRGGFKKVQGTVASSVSGERVGMEYAIKMARQTQGIALTVVAGMDYAQKVEEYHGRNVLSSAEQLAARELPAMMAQLRTKIQARL